MVYSAPMGGYDWSEAKNSALIAERGISFERVVTAIQDGDLLDEYCHPNAERYPNQRIMVVAVDGYGYLIPFVYGDSQKFLKTIIPSRKATRDYKIGSEREE